MNLSTSAWLKNPINPTDDVRGTLLGILRPIAAGIKALPQTQKPTTLVVTEQPVMVNSQTNTLVRTITVQVTTKFDGTFGGESLAPDANLGTEPATATAATTPSTATPITK